MNRTRSAGAVAAVALAIAPICATLLPSAAFASSAGLPGRIVFDGSIPNTVRDAIFSVNPDGSDLQQLTAGSGEDLGPDVSADGSKIVYSSGADNEHAELWVMNADGTDQHQLTQDGGRDWYPAWSPDGSTIAFRSDQTGDGDIYTIPAAGGTETRLTTAAGLDSVPEYSPDGTKILFHSAREDANPSTCGPCTEGVYVMNANGSGQTKLVGSPGEQDRFPNWSPDGSHIVFTREPTGAAQPDDGVYVAAADGSGATRVDGPSEYAESADFSPDGQTLVFQEGAYVMKTVPAAGGTPRTIETNAEAAPLSLDWSTIPGSSPAAQPPTVNGIDPATGPQAGGTAVTISGRHLLGTTAVHFGTAAATNVVVVSDVQLTATAPAGSGAVDVTVTNPAGTSAAGDPDRYTYDAPPAPPVPNIASTAPNAGPRAGGTAVTVTGTGFTGATSVTVGGHSVAFSVVSDTSLTLRTPASSTIGAKQIRVTTAGGTSPTGAASTFTYGNPPAVSKVSPASGSTAGGTSVTVTGSGFTGATVVRFGVLAGTNLRVVSPTKLVVTSPAARAGTVDVRVSGRFGTSAISRGDRYAYRAPRRP